MKLYTLLIILGSFVTLALTADVSHPFASAVNPETGEIDTDEVRAIYTQSLREAKARVADKLKGQNLPPEEVDSILKKWDKRIEESENYYPVTSAEKIAQLKEDIPKFLENYSREPKFLDKELMKRITNNLRESDKIDGRVAKAGERLVQPDVLTAMEPLREVVYSMAQSENETEEYHGVRYLTYLAPTDESMKLLYSIGQGESSEASIALDAIFKSGWDTPELRFSLVDQLERKASGETTDGGWAQVRGGRWGLVEAVPVYTRLLEQNYYENGHLSPISQLIRLGEAASSALPTIYKILEDGRNKGTLDERDLYYLRNAVAALGGIWPEVDSPSVVATEKIEVVEEVTPPEPAIEEITEVVTEELVEKPSNWLLWLIGAVFVGGGLFLIWVRWSRNR